MYLFNGAVEVGAAVIAVVSGVGTAAQQVAPLLT